MTVTAVVAGTRSDPERHLLAVGDADRVGFDAEPVCSIYCFTYSRECDFEYVDHDWSLIRCSSGGTKVVGRLLGNKKPLFVTGA